MKAPIKYVTSGGLTRYDWPDAEWLNDQYWVQDKSAQQIAGKFGMDSTTIRRWMDALGVPRRTPSEVKAGSRNPNWVDGFTEGRNYHRAHARKVLREAGVPRVCVWCRKEEDYLAVHHKNHNSGDHRLENLEYMCRTCHNLETQLWHLLKQDKINLTCEGRTMVIEFR